jgi:very-short-patch-repair endonuclease
MRQLIRLVDAGCHSELELWGHARVFSDPRLSHARLQHRVRTARGTKYLDRYFEAEMVNVELDGSAYHGRPGQRQRDIQRDAALAALGILVVRFSHRRLHAEPAGVVAEIVEILRVRRRQLGIAS